MYVLYVHDAVNSLPAWWRARGWELMDTCICMYVLYVHDAVNSLCAHVVARAGGSHARCDDEERDDDGTVSAVVGLGDPQGFLAPRRARGDIGHKPYALCQDLIALDKLDDSSTKIQNR